MITKGDFIEIEYTGIIKEDNEVFDTTHADVAKKNDLHSHAGFGPVVICVGEQQVLPGIDSQLIGKESGKEYSLVVEPEQGFGKKSMQLVQMIPANKFRQQKIEPMPGLQVNIDGITGTIKTVSGGRVMIDFNHPLAGKVLQYHVKVNKKISSDEEKAKALLKAMLGTPIEATVLEGKATVQLPQEIPKPMQDEINKKVMSLIDGIKSIEFSSAKEKNK